MNNITLDEINRVLKKAYKKQKKSNRRPIASNTLIIAWEFIDQLFTQEIESGDNDFYPLLLSIIPLFKPENVLEESFALMDYLYLLGITEKNEYFESITQYYLDTHQPQSLEYLINADKH